MAATTKSQFSQGRSTTPGVVMPVSAAAGDYAFYIVSAQGIADLITPPLGWVHMGYISSGTLGSSSSGVRMLVWRKRLTADDLGKTVSATVDQISDWAAAIIIVDNLHVDAEVIKCNVYGNLTPPSVDALVITGGVGTTTLSYRMVAKDAAGNSLGSNTRTITNAPNALTSSNYVTVKCNPVARAQNYDVYRGTTAGTETYLTTVDNTNIGGGISDQKRGYLDKGDLAPNGTTPVPVTLPAKVHLDGLTSEYPGRLQASFGPYYLLGIVAVQSTSAVTGGVTFTPPAGTLLLGSITQSTNLKLALAVTIEEVASPGDVGIGRVIDHTGINAPSASTLAVLRPLTSNGTPVATVKIRPPVAFPGQIVTLDGSQAIDADGDTVTYNWTQTAGPVVTLSSTTDKYPTFNMPTSAVTFTLVVTDPSSASASNSSITYNVASGAIPL
jgi:hypothetical protein